MLIDCITGLPRVQWEDSMYATIDQFTHFLVISSEYGVTQVTELSSGEGFRVHEQPRVISSDRTNFLFRYSRSSMEVDLQVMTTPGCLCWLLVMEVGSVLTGMSTWSSRRGGCRVGMTVGWL
jgi:hypothetical protein